MAKNATETQQEARIQNENAAGGDEGFCTDYLRSLAHDLVEAFHCKQDPPFDHEHLEGMADALGDALDALVKDRDADYLFALVLDLAEDVRAARAATCRMPLGTCETCRTVA